ncbi:MaoC/PaaZ C-terminal domain-containing protein [Paeniroseomonas aquatica]|uniref:MaoC/PaaZ C-terminal domain-containing protein n=1 Tax=Paeniroseomonas aquatica TaxID=373043 RepID=UPI003622A138
MTELYLEDFTPGQVFHSGRLRVTAEAIVAYAAEFDPQPFHLDDAAAHGTMFGGLAASGWHTAALTMKLLVGSPFRPAAASSAAGWRSCAGPARCARATRSGSRSRCWRSARARPGRSRACCGSAAPP